VEAADDALVPGKQGVITGGETDQRLTENTVAVKGSEMV